MPRSPKSYDEILRKTVPDLDLSWRPTAEQERLAYEGYRAMDPAEQALFKRIHDALVAAGCDTSSVTVEIDHDRVILRGKVRDQESMNRVAQVVGGVSGVTSVTDQLVIGA